MTLSILFYLFKIYDSVILIDVYNGWPLVQLKNQIGYEKKQIVYQVKECQILTWKLLLRKSDDSKLRFPKFKKCPSRSVFGDIQCRQTPLNFQTSCCNLIIRGTGANLCAAFLLFLFWKELWRFKAKDSMLFV